MPLIESRPRKKSESEIAFKKISPQKSLKQIAVSKGNKKVIGPVLSLEDHVHPDWWQRIFNSLYLKTDADVVEDNNITRQEVAAFLKYLNISKEDNILDLCCGQGRHVFELVRRGFIVEGLDRSRYLIQKARCTAKKENIHVRFREGDARKLPYYNDDFDVVLMLGNSFGYFENIQDDLKVLKEIFRVLVPWGKLLLDVADGKYLKERFQPRSWEWINKKLFVCRERSLSTDKNQLISREVITHVEKGVIADQFYAERLYQKSDLLRLLEEVGFSNIDFQGEIVTDSLRNQDLGMMEKRIIVTCQTKKSWTKRKIQSKEDTPKNIVVLFGDPNKPDLLKPNDVFDDDDFYTIDRLKSALKKIKGYNFIYFADHIALINYIQKLSEKTDLILNLCDEGYNNDPRMELHIPALLEMLNLPYTGSPPQCLAFCYDKSLIRGIAKEMEIPVPMAFLIDPDKTTFKLPFHFPVIVKPNFGDSSFGITQNSVVETHEQLINAISQIRKQFGYEKPILVEEFLDGNDLSVGIIGNPFTSYIVLPLIEEDYSKLPTCRRFVVMKRNGFLIRLMPGLNLFPQDCRIEQKKP